MSEKEEKTEENEEEPDVWVGAIRKEGMVMLVPGTERAKKMYKRRCRLNRPKVYFEISKEDISEEDVKRLNALTRGREPVKAMKTLDEEFFDIIQMEKYGKRDNIWRIIVDEKLDHGFKTRR